jgi:hypothetical protein
MQQKNLIINLVHKPRFINKPLSTDSLSLSLLIIRKIIESEMDEEGF